MHFEKHKWHRGLTLKKTLGNGMVAMAKKIGIDYLSVQEYIVSLNSFPIIFLGIFFSRFDCLEKLLSNEYSFILVVMKLCAEKISTHVFLLHCNYWGKLFMENSLILDKVV